MNHHCFFLVAGVVGVIWAPGSIWIEKRFRTGYWKGWTLWFIYYNKNHYIHVKIIFFIIERLSSIAVLVVKFHRRRAFIWKSGWNDKIQHELRDHLYWIKKWSRFIGWNRCSLRWGLLAKWTCCKQLLEHTPERW